MKPFFLDVISDAVQADFADRNIPAATHVGEWETFLEDVSPRVIFGLREGDQVHVGDETHYAPGLVVTGANTRARMLMANGQRVIVWVAFPALPEEPPEVRAKNARARTWELTSDTMAAIWRAHGGTFKWGSLTWLNEDRGDFTYGSALSFVMTLPLPIYDDPLTAGLVKGYDVITKLVKPEGGEMAGESFAGP